MPRRNRRPPARPPVSYTRLLAELRDAWAVRMGATWRDVKDARRAGVDPSTPAFRAFQRDRARAVEQRPAPRPVSMDDARSALAAYLG